MIDTMDAASSAVSLLRTSGFAVSVRGGSTLSLSRNGITTEAEMKLRRSATYEWDARQLLDSTSRHILVVVPRASRALLSVALGSSRLSVVSLEDSRLIWRGAEVYAVRPAPPTKQIAPRRSPWGRWALMRLFALSGAHRSQVALARDAGISQPGVSQLLPSLDDLVVRDRDGWRAADRSAMWDAFLEDYSGPGGIPAQWYGLDAVTAQTSRALAVAGETGVGALRSGDSAADELAPWRIPRRAVIYARAGLPMEKHGFAESALGNATLEVVVPADHTVWATSRACNASADSVDPLIAAWDVLRSGGPDAAEAAAKLKSVVLARTVSSQHLM